MERKCVDEATQVKVALGKERKGASWLPEAKAIWREHQFDQNNTE
jgi:hypothetical protein